MQASAEDRAPDRQVAELADVFDGADTSTGDDRDFPRFRERAGLLVIRTLHHPVPGDVGVEYPREWPVADASSDVDGALAGGFGPRAGRDDAVFRVQRQHDAIAKSRLIDDERLEPVPVLQRLGADDDSLRARREQLLDILGRSHAAPNLNAKLRRDL